MNLAWLANLFEDAVDFIDSFDIADEGLMVNVIPGKIHILFLSENVVFKKEKEICFF